MRVEPGAGAAYARWMKTAPDPRREIDHLSEQLEQLLARYQAAVDTNRTLREENARLAAERAQLAQRSEQARGRIESMIARLRTLESGA
jgi:cell division protein ZapB